APMLPSWILISKGAAKGLRLPEGFETFATYPLSLSLDTPTPTPSSAYANEYPERRCCRSRSIVNALLTPWRRSPLSACGEHKPAFPSPASGGFSRNAILYPKSVARWRAREQAEPLKDALPKQRQKRPSLALCQWLPALRPPDYQFRQAVR